MQSKVAVLRTSPRTIFEDYHRLLNLADYQNIIAREVETRAQDQHFMALFFPRVFHNTLATRWCYPRHETRWLRSRSHSRLPQPNRGHRRALGRKRKQTPPRHRSARLKKYTSLRRRRMDQRTRCRRRPHQKIFLPERSLSQRLSHSQTLYR